jgi:hypothetical protein
MTVCLAFGVGFHFKPRGNVLQYMHDNQPLTATSYDFKTLTTEEENLWNEFKSKCFIKQR